MEDGSYAVIDMWLRPPCVSLPVMWLIGAVDGGVHQKFPSRLALWS